MAATKGSRQRGTARKREGTVGQKTAAATTEVAGRVRSRLERELNVRKDRMTAKLDDLAETVRRVGEPLRNPPYGAIGEYADGAANRLHRVASDLRRRPVDDLAQDVAELARRRPGVFVGVGFAAGVLAARFLKSSSEEIRGQGDNRFDERGRARTGRGGEY